MKTKFQNLNENELTNTNGGSANPPNGLPVGGDFWIYVFGG